MSVDISKIIAPVFYPVHRAIRDNTHSSFWLKGGRGSTKSSFIAIQIILGIMRDPESNAVVVRKVGDTIRTSVQANFIWAIDILDVAEHWKVTYSPAELTYLPTGQQILMKGLDDPLKLKSIKAKKGYFKFLWFEEGSEYSGMEELRSVEQSVMRGGESFVEFVSYNPPPESYAWVNEESRIPFNGRYVHESNYLDVPPEWLGSKFIEDAEELRKHKPLQYAHEYMGEEIGRTESIVFSGCYTVDDFIPQPHWDGAYYGADWGFSQDPNVLVKVWIADNNLYIEREAYGVGVELDEIPEFFNQIEGIGRSKIWADCARPETISYVKNRGFNIDGSEKWKGSVEDGIAFMKSFKKIVIHPRCKHAITEMRLYSYKIDRLTNEVTADIVDKNNHVIDAIRYSLALHIKRKSKGIFGSDVLAKKRS